MAGLGARKSNNDQKYYVAANKDDYVSGGVAAGPALVRFPGAQNGLNLDATSLWVWAITGASILVVLGVHWSFGGRRFL